MAGKSLPPTVQVIRHPRSPYYWAYWRWEGKSRYTTLRTADLREAERRAKAIEAKLLRLYYGGLPPPPPAQATVKEVLDTYRRRLVPPRVSPHHAETQGDRLDAWEAALGAGTPASDITTPVIDRWLTSRLRRVSSTTARSELIALKAAYRQAVKDGLLPSVPWDVPAPKARRKGEEVLMPLAEIQARLHAADLSLPSGRCLWLAAYTGLRRADLASLTWGQIGEDGIVRLTTSKTGAFLAVPLPGRAWDALKPHRQADGERVIGWIDDVISHKMPHGPHAWRHAYASYLVRAGVDAPTVSRLLGHAEGVTAGYVHLAPEDLRGRVECLPY